MSHSWCQPKVGRQALVGRVDSIPSCLGVVAALTPGEVISEIFNVELHPGPVRGEHVQRHPPLLPDHDGLVAVGRQHGLDLPLVRLIRRFGAHQQPLRRVARLDATGAYPPAGKQVCAVLTAEAKVALDLELCARETLLR